MTLGKSFYCMSAVLIYSVLIALYLHCQKDDSIGYGLRKLMFYIPTTAMLLFYKNIGHDKYGCNEICFYSVICSFIIIIFNFLGLITNTYYLMYCFFGLIFALTLILLINMKRHGYFKYKYEND